MSPVLTDELNSPFVSTRGRLQSLQQISFLLTFVGGQTDGDNAMVAWWDSGVILMLPGFLGYQLKISGSLGNTQTATDYWQCFSHSEYYRVGDRNQLCTSASTSWLWHHHTEVLVAFRLISVYFCTFLPLQSYTDVQHVIFFFQTKCKKTNNSAQFPWWFISIPVKSGAGICNLWAGRRLKPIQRVRRRDTLIVQNTNTSILILRKYKKKPCTIYVQTFCTRQYIYQQIIFDRVR